MTTVIVGMALVGVMGGIRALSQADIKAQKVQVLQRLAMQKMNELGSTVDVSTADTSGDFSDYGYQDISWQAQVQTSSVDNVDIVKVTATQANLSQSLSGLYYIRPTTTTTGSTGQ